MCHTFKRMYLLKFLVERWTNVMEIYVCEMSGYVCVWLICTSTFLSTCSRIAHPYCLEGCGFESCQLITEKLSRANGYLVEWLKTHIFSYMSSADSPRGMRSITEWVPENNIFCGSVEVLFYFSRIRSFQYGATDRSEKYTSVTWQINNGCILEQFG